MKEAMHNSFMHDFLLQLVKKGVAGTESVRHYYEAVIDEENRLQGSMTRAGSESTARGRATLPPSRLDDRLIDSTALE